MRTKPRTPTGVGPFLLRRGHCAHDHPIKSMDDLCVAGRLASGEKRYICRECSRSSDRERPPAKYEWEDTYQVLLACGLSLIFRYDRPEEKELWCSWHQHYAQVLEVAHVGRKRRD